MADRKQLYEVKTPCDFKVHESLDKPSVSNDCTHVCDGLNELLFFLLTELSHL